MYQTEHDGIRNMQRQECFILANNFVGPEEIHADIFVSRILMPMLNVLTNVIDNHSKKVEQDLKYLIINLHDT